MGILLSIILIVAFGCGYIYRDFQLFRKFEWHKLKLQEELDKTNEELNSLGVKNVYKLKHEILNGVHYFFTEKDDTFVAQGRTLEDAATHYTKLQGKDILGWFTHTDLKKNFCFVNDKCMEFEHEQH